MSISGRFDILLKSLRQVGFSRAALYALYKIGLKTGHYRRIECKRAEAAPIISHPLFTLPTRTELAQVLGENGQRALLAEADEIVMGKFRRFGGEAVELKWTFDQPLQHWTAYETNPQLLSTLPDIKFIWEPARFGWAYVLGRAYHLTGDETYAEAFWRHFETFLAANPPYLGPHWMNGQEVAIRLMTLVWASQVFAPPAADETVAGPGVERRARLAQSIAQHAARIPPTLIYARAQDNNHLVTEAAALYTAGRALGHARWRALGWRWLNRALQRQISPYGEYIQHSANYHRVMLQVALWVNAIKEVDWPYPTLRALGRATHWLFSLLDPASGRTPNLGANDGALILPLSVTPFHDFRPTVQAAARAFLRYQMPGGVWDEMSLWLGLDAHEKVNDSSAYLADHLRGRESWAYLRASTFRSRLGHIDQLHLDLWWRGLNVAQDAGTYLYNAPPPWDNPLTTARIHNTVTVDGHDPMTRGGRFMTLDWFPAYAKRDIVLEENVLGQVTAYHTGYRGVRHERTVTVYADEHWRVEDRLLSSAPHIYRLHWLLPDWVWQVEKREPSVEVHLQTPQGKILLILRAASLPSEPSLSMQLSLVRCGAVIFGQRQVQPYEGWYSPTYGTKIPALSLALEVSAPQGVTFLSEFLFPAQ
ncbi:MAG: hypothetical protein Fur0043_03550 [Anaerolineales bacterium]